MYRGLYILYIYVLKYGWKPLEYREDYSGGFIHTLSRTGGTVRFYLYFNFGEREWNEQSTSYWRCRIYWFSRCRMPHASGAPGEGA